MGYGLFLQVDSDSETAVRAALVAESDDRDEIERIFNELVALISSKTEHVPDELDS